MPRKSQASIPGLAGSAGRPPISSRSWPAPVSVSMRLAGFAGIRSTSAAAACTSAARRAKPRTVGSTCPTGSSPALPLAPRSTDATVTSLRLRRIVNNPEQIWDQSNSANAVRAALDASELSWAVPHTFRRTVATLLDQANLPIARIADQLGHADVSMTARVYLGRDLKGDKSELAEVL